MCAVCCSMCGGNSLLSFVDCMFHVRCLLRGVRLLLAVCWQTVVVSCLLCAVRLCVFFVCCVKCVAC